MKENFKVTKEMKWAMAHRLQKGYVGACNNIHGHTYKALLTFESKELNRVDMVVDFKEINTKVKSWIDENWDHALMIYVKDLPLIELCEKEKMKHFIMPENTTAEEMSKWLYKVCEAIVPEAKISSVTIYETDTSYCTYSEG